jgi:hypothetical protein
VAIEGDFGRALTLCVVGELSLHLLLMLTQRPTSPWPHDGAKDFALGLGPSLRVLLALRPNEVFVCYTVLCRMKIYH